MNNEIENYVKFAVLIEYIALILAIMFISLAAYSLVVNYNYTDARLAFKAAGWSAVIFCLSWLFVEIFR